MHFHTIYLTLAAIGSTTFAQMTMMPRAPAPVTTCTAKTLGNPCQIAQVGGLFLDGTCQEIFVCTKSGLVLYLREANVDQLSYVGPGFESYYCAVTPP
jgi:hypothetical protein